jgi:hypothetical protein
VGDEYETTIEIAARQLDADSAGVESEVPLRAPFDVAVYAEGTDEPIYLGKHWLTTGAQRVVMRVPRKPTSVAVDPFGLMIERNTDDNVRAL